MIYRRGATLLLATQHILQMPETFAGVDAQGFPIVDNVRTYAAEERLKVLLECALTQAQAEPTRNIWEIFEEVLVATEVTTSQEVSEVMGNLQDEARDRLREHFG